MLGLRAQGSEYFEFEDPRADRLGFDRVSEDILTL